MFKKILNSFLLLGFISTVEATWVDDAMIKSDPYYFAFKVHYSVDDVDYNFSKNEYDRIRTKRAEEFYGNSQKVSVIEIVNNSKQLLTFNSGSSRKFEIAPGHSALCSRVLDAYEPVANISFQTTSKVFAHTVSNKPIIALYKASLGSEVIETTSFPISSADCVAKFMDAKQYTKEKTGILELDNILKSEDVFLTVSCVVK
tara:strand:- start:245 stop:847 length:603 start_codon:yes stop_codon:yes gene_type:complete